MPGQNALRARSPRRQRGAALVEYAFVFIVLFSMLFGISGFGHALYVYHAINNSAKEGTRWAAVNGYLCGTNTGGDGTCDGTNGMNSGPASKADIVAHVQANLPASLDVANAVVKADFLPPSSGIPAACTTQVGTLPAAEPNYPGCTVQVTIGYAYTFYFPLIPVTTNVDPNCSPNPGYCFFVTSEMIIAH